MSGKPPLKIFQCLENPAEKVPRSGRSVRGGLLDEGFDHVHNLLLLSTRQRGYPKFDS